VAYDGLPGFVTALERERELVRIAHEVSAELEITEITDRASKRGGPALLFENVTGHTMPVLINAFGSKKRMAMALGVEDVEEVATRIQDLITRTPPDGLLDKARTALEMLRLGAFLPKRVRAGRCKQIIVHGGDVDLTRLPVLKCWPQDGGPFITLPMVFTRDPDTGTRNVGMYRLQVFDRATTGMHWHTHKTGADHYRRYCRRGQRMPVAVALGSDPAVTYSATAPLPPGLDEMLFAGFLRRQAVDIVPCETCDLEVPADAEIVLEGYVEPGELRREGPFGDHTGYYSLADDYPVFHVTCITHARDPIYPATIVGKPPMEDCYMAKATERIFLPLIRTVIPELVDMALPLEGIFHNLVFVSIRKSFPHHARKVMHAVWGLGQLMFTKIVVVCDEHVDVQNTADVLWRLGNNVDCARDIVLSSGPVDVLDHSGPLPSIGGKMGIDATRKWPEEGHTREWPDDIVMSDAVKARIDAMWDELGITP